MLCLYYVANQDLVDRYKNVLLITAANIEAPCYVQHMQQFYGMIIQTVTQSDASSNIFNWTKGAYVHLFTMTSAYTELLQQTESY